MPDKLFFKKKRCTFQTVLFAVKKTIGHIQVDSQSVGGC